MPRPVIEPRSIVIVGGGVGALEALLALSDLGERAFAITVVAPNDRFELRALSVTQPFFVAGSDPDVAAWSDIARQFGATLKQATVSSVDAEQRTVTCSDGETLSYDTLVLSPGARSRPAYANARTFGIGDPLELGGLVADLEGGYSDSVAFVVPEGVSWPLPLYELALMTSRQVYGMNRDVDLTILTPEPAPLAVFGPEASAAVSELLQKLRITVHCGAPVTVARGRVGMPEAGLELRVNRIVSLPLLDGPRLEGVPANADGFIPIDEFCRVHGTQHVYAIGDATDLLVKQGGLACQQADVAARHIAAAAGGPLEATPLAPVLRGRLLTGDVDRFMRRDLAGAHGDTDDLALWWPPAKVYGDYLSRWIDRRHYIDPKEVATPPPGVDVEAPLPAYVRARTSLGLDPLGPIDRGPRF